MKITAKASETLIYNQVEVAVSKQKVEALNTHRHHHFLTSRPAALNQRASDSSLGQGPRTNERGEGQHTFLFSSASLVRF